ncbi:hypothetical protein ABG79_02198 [Caloramator mitchellensis]|uniref:Uncharacterized protein n=1 Tax=Caloramator mitchellensis TaxID=908809 RepID=A0A0R3JZS4_CALMK|nr:hypothetical protein [Caloramator mitchellensis]KRQ86066.1 hypothetical protein ABG79_02198 [Caloramator mitchellensis]
MTLLARKCIELIEAGKLTIDKIINQQVKAEVEQYFAEKESSQ